MANTYQGKFPMKDQGDDGYTLAPVRNFHRMDTAFTTCQATSGNGAATGIGWTTTQIEGGRGNEQSQGPDTPFDPAEPAEKKRVQRGGSFLCNDQYCSRYIVGTRGKAEVNTGTNHLGFRCVKSADQKAQASADKN